MGNNRAKSAMTAIALLIESGATPSSVTATLDLFRIAARKDPSDPIQIDVYSSQGGAIPLADGLSLQTSALPTRLTGYDAVILPGFFASGFNELVAQIETVWQPAIERLHSLEPSTLVAASCYGTFVLAESGLLDNGAATTSWWFQSEFKQRYPSVRVNVSQALVDAGTWITAGAMTAHTDLSLHLLRRLKGTTLARSVGSTMLVDESRASQRPFMVLQRVFGDPLVDQAISIMERRLSASISSSELAEKLHVSYRTLHRRFRTETGMSPVTYLQALRIERAKELLEQTRKSVAQVASAVGYEDESSFRRIFTRLTEISPARYRERFSRSF